MEPMWKTDDGIQKIEAWTLEDGTLVIKRRVSTKEPVNGFNFVELVDCLMPVKEAA